MSMRYKYLILITTLINNMNAQILQTVPFVDLNKYAGKWYEIHSCQKTLQKGCHNTNAKYTLTDKG